MSAEFVGLYKAIPCDNQMAYSELRNPDALVHLNETVQHSGDTLLHVAAKWKRRNIAEKIISLQPSLLFATNIKGETPLHVAASVGSQEVTQLIIDRCHRNETVENGERLLRKKTKKVEETALHRAVRNGHGEVVQLLIGKDTELAKLENKEGDSPLFMAVDTKHFEIARIILNVPYCSFKGRKNMNALHAAIARQQKDRAIININDLGEGSIALAPALALAYLYLIQWRKFPWEATDSRATTIAKELIAKREPELLEQQDDQSGWTPLHYAAHVNATQIIELLLLAKHSIAYIKDHDGMTALHVAAKQGHVSAMRSLRKICPEICDAVDNKGLSALHIAVKSGKINVVSFILKFFDDDIINMRDYQGNTALHLAASQRHFHISYLLVKDRRSSKVAINSDGVTVMDIIQSSVDALAFKGWMKYLLTNCGGTVSLEHCLGRENNENPLDPQLEQTQKTVLDEPDDGDIRQVDLIAATLIATVSFAAGLAVPGGFKDDDPDKGTAVLAKKTDLHKFVIFNAIAFYCSVSSIFIRWTAFSKKKSLFYNMVRPLIQLSMVAMAVAFIYGTSAFLGVSEAELATGVKHISWVCLSFVYLAVPLQDYLQKAYSIGKDRMSRISFRKLLVNRMFRISFIKHVASYFWQK